MRSCEPAAVRDTIKLKLSTDLHRHGFPIGSIGRRGSDCGGTAGFTFPSTLPL